MKYKILMVLLLIVAVIVACNSEETTTDESISKEDKGAADTSELYFIDQGKKIASATGEALINRLTTAIQEGGFPYAIQFCSVEAIPLTDSLSAVHNVNIQRVTHKPRNQANTASDEEMRIITAYISHIEDGKQIKPRVDVTESGKHIFYAPIVINNSLCLNCHGIPGEGIHEETLTAINEKYPADKATGFKIGELRGMWKVEFE